LFVPLLSVLAIRRDLPRLEIHSDKLVIKGFFDDVTVLRKDVAVFAVRHPDRDELVAYSDPIPLKRSPNLTPRSCDTVMPMGLTLSVPELQEVLMRWLAGKHSP
jgi:hypothetical protein